MEKEEDKKPSAESGFPTVSLPGTGSGDTIQMTQIGPYKLIRTLGEGGFGYVFLANQQEPVKRQVALKIIKPGMDSKQVIARFEAERQALALLNHPNIAKIFDGGNTDNGRPYFVMEHVEGIPITDYCDKYQLSIKERLELFIIVCEAIHYAHQKGIIHRDIKPSNVLVCNENGHGVPKLIDFGIAKALGQNLTEETIFTAAGQLIGTPEYMSPEQADLGNRDIDTLADVYSLGVLLYELLTGALPFNPKTLRKAAFKEIQRIICEQEPPRPSTILSVETEEAKTIAENRHTALKNLKKQLHDELEWIPLKALRKERQQRYKTATEFADDIRNYLNGNPLIAGPESTSYKVKKYLVKHKFSSTIVGLLFIILIAFSYTSFYLYMNEIKARRNLEKAQKELGSQTNNLVQYGKARMFIAFLDAWHGNKVDKAALYFVDGREKQAVKFLTEDESSNETINIYLKNTSQGDLWFSYFVVAECMRKNKQSSGATNYYLKSIQVIQEHSAGHRLETDWYMKTIKSRLYDLTMSVETKTKKVY